MSLRMLLEGPDLKGILREVETNYGRDFHVIQAEQVRSGGVGGFFTKQHYEVTVEIADPRAIANPRAIADIAAQPQTAGMSLNELATRSQNDQAAASAQDWARDLLEKARALNAGENTLEDSSLGADTDPSNTAEEVDPDASSWADLSTRTGKKRKFRLKLRNKKSTRRTGSGSSRTAPASMEQQKRLQELLTHGPLVEDHRASEIINKNYEDEDDDFHDLPPAARLVAQMDGTPHLMRGSQQESNASVTQPGTKEVIAGVRINEFPKTVEDVHVIAPAPAPARVPAPVPAPAPAPAQIVTASTDIYGPESEAFWRVQIGDQIKAQRDKVEKFYSRRGPIGTEEARLIQIFAMAEKIARTLPDSSSAAINRKPLGVPAEIAEVAEVAEANFDVVAEAPVAITFDPVVSTPKPAVFNLKFQAPEITPVIPAESVVPQGVPTAPGEVLVLIGDVQEAYLQACAMSEIADCGGIDVLAITPSGMTVTGVDPEDHFRHSSAEKVFAQARTSDSPTIVIVHAPFPIGNDDLERVRIVKAIEALDTPHVWAVVDASHAVSSLSRWTQCLGHISALSVVNAKDSTNPQALKALGIPIVFIDGQPCFEDQDTFSRLKTSHPVNQIANISV